VTLDWLTKNSAFTQGATTDQALRTRFYPFRVEVLSAAVEHVHKRLPRWEKKSETYIDSNRILFIFERKTRLFKFIDDVEITLSKCPYGTNMDAKSSSRIGKGDLGQNRRNIVEFFEILNIELKNV
tara:strand:- start:20821 stop:21198 length:378 start_codon:yes stop_codon:yes gene_type:complete